jgi:hypothetical protein
VSRTDEPYRAAMYAPGPAPVQVIVPLLGGHLRRGHFVELVRDVHLSPDSEPRIPQIDHSAVIFGTRRGPGETRRYAEQSAEDAAFLQGRLEFLGCRLAVRRDCGTVSRGRRSLPMHPRNVTMALR